MQEIITGFLRDWDKAPSLDNLDFDTYIYLRRAREVGNNFEFGRYNWKEGSVEIKIERPEFSNDQILVPGSAEEWREKRKFYLKHCGNNVKLLKQGITEGYIIDEDAEWMIAPNTVEDWNREELEEEHLESIYLESLREKASKLTRAKHRKTCKSTKIMLNRLIHNSGLSKSLVARAKENSYEVYEILKQAYCSGVQSTEEYEHRIAKIVFALEI